MTGEELGAWRYVGLAGFVGLAELRNLRHADVALPSLNRLRTHFENTGTNVVCYECVLNTLDSRRYPYNELGMISISPHKVIPALESMGFRQASDLQPGDVVVWMENFSESSTTSGTVVYVEDLAAGSAEHIGIYLGRYNGRRTILSGNWPTNYSPGMYDMDALISVPSGDTQTRLSDLSVRYYRLPDK